MGGEKGEYDTDSDNDTGSPPHGRGKGRRIVPNVEGLRITPAWAGKSMTAPGRSSRTGDHPRVGGEKAQTDRPDHAGLGSPPRRRGKGHTGKTFNGLMGITPA